MKSSKSFRIEKEEVWRAYKLVKANKGAAGVDDQSIEDFERRLGDNLFKIWNRMSSDSYHPPPVRTVEIPKKNGGKRVLGIPTVGDRVVKLRRPYCRKAARNNPTAKCSELTPAAHPWTMLHISN